MLDILLHGVSTRNYKAVIPAMAETAGVSRSAVSRAAIEASEAEVEALLSRRFDDLKLLVIYVDGLVFGDYTMIGVVGVDAEGNKHVLGTQREESGFRPFGLPDPQAACCVSPSTRPAARPKNA